MGVFQCDVFQNNVFQGPCDVAVEPPAPAPDSGGVGRSYFPNTPRRKRRIVFIDEEIREKLEQKQQLTQAIVAIEPEQADNLVSFEEINAQIAALSLAIERLRAEREEAESFDDDAAINAILQLVDDDEPFVWSPTPKIQEIEEVEEPEPEEEAEPDDVAEVQLFLGIAQAVRGAAEMAKAASSPKEVVLIRDKSGKIVGAKTKTIH